MQSLPEESELFFIEDGQQLASWGVLVSSTRNWALTEVNAQLRSTRDFAALISFETAAEFRGRGLYPLLLASMVDRIRTQTPGRETLIWCKRSNVASARGITKAGFTEMAQIYRRRPYGALLVDEMVAGALQSTSVSITNS